MTIKSALSYINWLDMPSMSVTDDETQTIAGLPISNAQLEEVNQVWGLTADSSNSSYVRIFNMADSSGNARPVGVFCIVFANRIDGTDIYENVPMFGATDTIRVRGYDDVDAGGTELFDSTLVQSGVSPSVNYWCFVVPTSDASCKSIELTMNATSKVGSADEFLWISRLWAGPLIRLERTFQTGHRLQWGNNDFGEVRRTNSYPLNKVKDQNGELDEMIEFEKFTNTKHQFLFIERISEPTKTAVIGKRSETTGFSSQFFKTYGFTLRQEETW